MLRTHRLAVAFWVFLLVASTAIAPARQVAHGTQDSVTEAKPPDSLKGENMEGIPKSNPPSYIWNGGCGPALVKTFEVKGKASGPFDGSFTQNVRASQFGEKEGQFSSAFVLASSLGEVKGKNRGYTPKPNPPNSAKSWTCDCCGTPKAAKGRLAVSFFTTYTATLPKLPPHNACVTGKALITVVFVRPLIPGPPNFHEEMLDSKPTSTTDCKN
jgi:hypothetical protein